MNTPLLVSFALGAGLAMQPAHAGAAPESPAAVDATTPAVVAAAAPAPQRGASAPSGAATDAAVPAPPPALDWSYTPRRSFPVRRR